MISYNISPGTFFGEGDLDEHQMRAIMLVEKIGERLIRENPEIADLYRRGGEFERQEDIAREYVHSYDQFPQVAIAAVCYVIRKLIPKEERREINVLRNTRRLEATVGGFDSEKFKKHCRRASQRRHKLHGVNTDAMIRGRGHVPWNKKERKYVMNLLGNGLDDHDEIAAYINVLFHDGERVRHKKSVYDMIRYENRRKNK